MLQPFLIFETKYLQGLKKMGKRYFVSQSYPRGAEQFAELVKTPILLSDYSDPGLAKIHYNAVKQDRYAAILDFEKPEHLQKVFDMLGNESKYRLFWSVFPSREELEKSIDQNYKDKMMTFIQQRLGWHVSGTAKVNPKIEVIFGELHINLKYGRYDRVRVKFEEIEYL